LRSLSYLSFFCPSNLFFFFFFSQSVSHQCILRIHGFFPIDFSLRSRRKRLIFFSFWKLLKQTGRFLTLDYVVD
ncbi:hypothetical protein N665_0008s0140, partial [Sinapis alba]